MANEINHLIWLGVGHAEEPTFDFDRFDKLTLIDARDEVNLKLSKKFASKSNVSIRNDVITNSSLVETFKILSIRNKSRLGDITELFELYPSLEIKSEMNVTSSSLQTIFKECSFDDELITLIVDLPDISSELLRNIFEVISKYKVQALYIFNDGEVKQGLFEEQFIYLGKIFISDGGTFYHFFRDQRITELEAKNESLRDYKNSIIETVKNEMLELKNQVISNEKSLKQELFQTKNDIQQLRVMLREELKSEVQGLRSDIRTNYEGMKTEFSKLDSLCEQKLKEGEQAKLDAIEKAIDTILSHQLDLLTTKLSAGQLEEKALVQEFCRTQNEFKEEINGKIHVLKNDIHKGYENTAAEFSQLIERLATKLNQERDEDKVHKLFDIMGGQIGESIQLLRGLPFKIQKASYNTSKQIESFISVIKYLNNHELPLNFHGWPISPDIGLTLIDFIENKDIDVVIEFGSGTSSILLSRAFQQANPVTDDWILSKPIISFEHNEVYLEKTQTLLTKHNCNSAVDLVHSPLVDFKYKDGSKYLYYDCASKLELIAKELESKKRNILVLIDGPPGSTNKNARFPALPQLLNHLHEHRLFVVMDDYNRPDEKETFDQWESLVKERCLKSETQVIETEKGLSILTIN